MAQVRSPGFNYTHRERGNVLVQDLTDWSGQRVGMNQVEREWLSHVRHPHITASVTRLGSEINLSEQIQHHLAQEWGENASDGDLEKLAFVSAGTEPRVVSEAVDTDPVVHAFGSFQAALQWARQ